MKNKVLGLIPTRLGSTRLPAKPLLSINGCPLIVHVYRRARLSKILNDVIVCCDDKKILDIAKMYNVKCILTSKKHKNGTERIYEGYKKIKKKYNFIVDIQGDEPLINPKHIDQVIKFHLKNKKTDIILPTLKTKITNNTNLIKVVTNNFDEVLYLSRSNIPLEFKKKNKFIKKHLSIISFKPDALKKFYYTKKGNLESIEDIELLRALEAGLKIKTLNLKGESFSIDVKKDFLKAKEILKTDRLFKRYF